VSLARTKQQEKRLAAAVYDRARSACGDDFAGMVLLVEQCETQHAENDRDHQPSHRAVSHDCPIRPLQKPTHRRPAAAAAARWRSAGIEPAVPARVQGAAVASPSPAIPGP